MFAGDPMITEKYTGPSLLPQVHSVLFDPGCRSVISSMTIIRILACESLLDQVRVVTLWMTMSPSIANISCLTNISLA